MSISVLAPESPAPAMLLGPPPVRCTGEQYETDGAHHDAHCDLCRRAEPPAMLAPCAHRRVTRVSTWPDRRVRACLHLRVVRVGGADEEGVRSKRQEGRVVVEGDLVLGPVAPEIPEQVLGIRAADDPAVQDVRLLWRIGIVVGRREDGGVRRDPAGRDGGMRVRGGIGVKADNVGNWIWEFLGCLGYLHGVRCVRRTVHGVLAHDIVQLALRERAILVHLGALNPRRNISRHEHGRRERGVQRCLVGVSREVQQATWMIHGHHITSQKTRRHALTLRHK